MPLPVLAQEQSPGIWHVANGADYRIDAHGREETIINNHVSGKGIMVPTNTPAEWTSFIDNIPTDVTLGDVTPNAFAFLDLTGPPDTLFTSSVVQIKGIDVDARVSIAGEGAPQYRICADLLCLFVHHDWSASAGDISPNEFLQLRLTTSPTALQTRSATVNVGTRDDTWVMTSSL